MTKIHKTALVDKKATIKANSIVEPYCIIGASTIGSSAIIRSYTRIYPDNQIGNNFITGNFVNIRESNQIGNNVSIGTHSTIEHHVKIADDVRIHSNVFVPEYCVLEEGCWLGPNVVLTNAKYPRFPNVKDNLKGVIVQKNAKIGANSTILPGIIIGENALIGAGSVVTKDVPPDTVVVGNPARILNSVDRVGYTPTAVEQRTVPQVDLKAEYRSIKPEIDSAIEEILKETAFILGDALKEFEASFAKYCDSKYCIGVSSGTSALELSLKVLNLPIGSQVICPTHTFAATAEAVINNQLTPVFVDIDPLTHNLDPNKVSAAINAKTKAIIAVHMNGYPADLRALKKISKAHHLFLIEDAAQAHGATAYGKKIGTFGDLACFSFFPAKNLGCYGDGGAIITNRSRFAKQLSLLRNHGRVSKYNSIIVGRGERLDNIQAAILNVKLRHLDQWNSKRRQAAKLYSKLLSDLPEITLPHTNPQIFPSYYVFTIQTTHRDSLHKFLADHHVGSGIYYPLPLHSQKAFSGYAKVTFPVAESVCSRIISLPMHPFLTSEDIEHVCQLIHQFFHDQK